MAGNLNRDGADIAWFKYGDELAVKMIVDTADWDSWDYEKEMGDIKLRKQKAVAMFLTKQQALELIKDLQKEFAEELKKNEANKKG